ncbi:hypothetical protein RRG08_037536 [Elysia crispata]|uniref:PH domain-containing protein n=1 Tax=Elysia crispata TaxID=231223 RepID=A0AAE1DT14_9GAST|nr:hypothetical protein RRG08_037536 [Elysia crispata]
MSFNRWKRRYFKLKGRRLFYAKDRKSAIFNEIDISNVSVAECSTRNINHSFQMYVCQFFRNVIPETLQLVCFLLDLTLSSSGFQRVANSVPSDTATYVDAAGAPVLVDSFRVNDGGGGDSYVVKVDTMTGQFSVLLRTV